MLRRAFAKHGQVTDAFVAYNGAGSRGFGFVTFGLPRDASRAVRRIIRRRPNAKPLFPLTTRRWQASIMNGTAIIGCTNQLIAVEMVRACCFALARERPQEEGGDEREHVIGPQGQEEEDNDRCEPDVLDEEIRRCLARVLQKQGQLPSHT
eukprot:1104207-Prymnesium_polylepis.1